MAQPNKNLSNLGSKVTTHAISFNDLATRAWGSEFRAPDHGVYEFSNGRKYDSTDMNASGLYNGGISDQNYLMVGNGQYPDMPSNNHMLQETGDKIIQD